MGHALEIFLVGETHAGPVAACRDNFRTGLHNGICRAVVGAPPGQVGIVAEGHDAGGIGIARHRKLLHGNLGLRALGRTSVGHEHRGAADRRIEHLHKSLLGGHVRPGEQIREFPGEIIPFRLAEERIPVLDGGYAGRRDVPGTRAVDELTADVRHELVAVEHTHPAPAGHVGDVGHLHVLAAAVGFELLPVSGPDHYRHPLLGLAYGEFGGVQSAVFHGHPVETDVQSGGELAYRDADSSGAEIVGFLYKPGDLGAAEQPLQLAFLGGVSFLHLASAGLDGAFGMLLGRTCRPSYSVTAGPSAEQQYHIARNRAFPAHVLRLDRSDHGAGLEPLGDIAGMIYLAHACGCKAYLVAVAGIACGGLAADDPLRKLSGKSRAHGGGDVAGSGDAHRLIYVRPAGQRVAYRPAETGGRPSERFYLGGMVMGLVLELQQPFLGGTVHIHVHVDAACVVLLALLQVVKQALLPEPAGAYCRQLHEAQALAVPAELMAYMPELLELRLYLRTNERIVHGNLLKLGRKGGMAAVVAPIGVQYAQLRLGGIALLAPEILHDLGKVFRAHGEPPPAAECRVFLRLHVNEAFEGGQGLHVHLVVRLQHRQVLGPRLDGIDEIAPYPGEVFAGEVVIEYQQPRAAYLDIRTRVYQVHAVDRGRRALVELAGDVLHRKIFPALEAAAVGHRVGHYLAEDGIAAFLQQLVGEAEEVVDIEQPQAAQRQ